MGVNTNSRLLTTPPTQQMASSVLIPMSCEICFEWRRTSRPERQIRRAVSPAESAPSTADSSPMLQAGLGWPRNLTKANTLVNAQAIMVQIG